MKAIAQGHSRAIAAALFLIAAAVFLIVGVQGLEHANPNNFRDQSVQIPVIESYADPGLFQGDFLLEVRASYVTLFYPALGYLSRAVPLEPLMLALYVLASAATLAGVYGLTVTVFHEPLAGLVAALLWMAYLPNPGGDFTHSPFVTHTTFAAAFQVWALVLFFRRRPLAAAVVLGVAANINAMTSFFVAVMWGAALLVDPRRSLARIARIYGVLLIFALPVLVWRLSLPFSEASLGEFVEIVRLRLWYAVFPFSFSPLLWAGFGAMLVLWRVSWRFGRPGQHRQIVAMVGGIAVLCLVGIVFSELVPVEFIIELQLVRSTWLINLLILVYVAHMITRLLETPQSRRRWIAFALMLPFVLPRLVIEFFPPGQPTPYPLVIDLDTPWVDAHGAAVAAILACTLVVLLGSVWALRRGAVNRGRAAWTLGWFAASLVGLALPAFVPAMLPAAQQRATGDWRQTLLWIEANTGADAYFVTPPQYDGFRMVARRGYVGDWKDGTVGIFHNGWAIEWYERMLDLGFDPDAFTFAPMTQPQVCEVIARYGASHAVVLREWNIQGEAVYENDTFAVMPVEGIACAFVEPAS